jgi:hypothetical protein
VAEGNLLIDVTLFASAIRAYYRSINAKNKKKEVARILGLANWFEHYKDKTTGRRVLSELNRIEHEHERNTAISLAQMNYDVVFAPAGLFKRGQKRFDVYLLRDMVVLEADLKSIFSMNPDTIAQRIVGGADQASRLVLDIRSNISIKDIVDGLRSGTARNDLVKEIMLFYKKRFYILPKSLIWSRRIFDILKSEKGFQ